MFASDATLQRKDDDIRDISDVGREMHKVNLLSLNQWGKFDLLSSYQKKISYIVNLLPDIVSDPKKMEDWCNILQSIKNVEIAKYLTQQTRNKPATNESYNADPEGKCAEFLT